MLHSATRLLVIPSVLLLDDFLYVHGCVPVFPRLLREIILGSERDASWIVLEIPIGSEGPLSEGGVSWMFREMLIVSEGGVSRMIREMFIGSDGGHFGASGHRVAQAPRPPGSDRWRTMRSKV